MFHSHRSTADMNEQKKQQAPMMQRNSEQLDGTMNYERWTHNLHPRKFSIKIHNINCPILGCTLLDLGVLLI